jgi:acetyltransferase-like isoleucine patch superfamily enzyme
MVGSDVWIETSAISLPGVMINDDAVITAGALVAENVQTGCVFDEVAARLFQKINTRELRRERGSAPE